MGINDYARRGKGLPRVRERRPRIPGPGLPRVEDYYLGDPEAFAQRYTVDADGQVIELARMNGDAYEAWIAGVDPDTAGSGAGCGTTPARCDSWR